MLPHPPTLLGAAAPAQFVLPAEKLELPAAVAAAARLQVQYPYVAWQTGEVLDARAHVPLQRFRLWFQDLSKRAGPVQVSEFTGRGRPGFYLLADGWLWYPEHGTLKQRSTTARTRSAGSFGAMQLLRVSRDSLLLLAPGSKGEPEHLVLRQILPNGGHRDRRLDAPPEPWKRDRQARVVDHHGSWYAKQPCNQMDPASGALTQLLPFAAEVCSRAGNLVLAVGEDDTICVIDTETGRRLRMCFPDRVLHVSPLGVIFNGPFGARLWDPLTGRRRDFVLAQGERIQVRRRGKQIHLLLVPDGRRAPAGRGPRLVDPEAAEVPAEFPGPVASIAALREQGLEAEDPNERSQAAAWLAFYYGPRAHTELSAMLSAQLRQRNHFVLSSVHGAFFQAGRRSDAALLRQRDLGWPQARLSRTLALLGDADSLPYLQAGIAKIPKGNRDDIRACREAIAHLRERPRLEELWRRARQDPTWR